MFSGIRSFGLSTIQRSINQTLLIGQFQISSRFIHNGSLIGTLRDSPGAQRNGKRLGRGPSSGKGKTSGRGQKGQKARSHVKSWFEGGQTPIYKLFPKRGFRNPLKVELKEVNLATIRRCWYEGKIQLKEGEVLNIRNMIRFGVITGHVRYGVKLLGIGKETYDLPIKIETTKASLDAIQAIEKAGGSFVAKYYNSLGLRAHLVPGWFLRKRGRLPLEARPIRRRDIQYYTDPVRRGFMSDKADQIQKTVKQVEKSVSKTDFKRQLEFLKSSPTSVINPNIGFTESKVLKASELLASIEQPKRKGKSPKA